MALLFQYFMCFLLNTSFSRELCLAKKFPRENFLAKSGINKRKSGINSLCVVNAGCQLTPYQITKNRFSRYTHTHVCVYCILTNFDFYNISRILKTFMLNNIINNQNTDTYSSPAMSGKSCEFYNNVNFSLMERTAKIYTYCVLY